MLRTPSGTRPHAPPTGSARRYSTSSSIRFKPGLRPKFLLHPLSLVPRRRSETRKPLPWRKRCGNLPPSQSNCPYTRPTPSSARPLPPPTTIIYNRNIRFIAAAHGCRRSHVWRANDGTEDRAQSHCESLSEVDRCCARRCEIRDVLSVHGCSTSMHTAVLLYDNVLRSAL